MRRCVVLVFLLVGLTLSACDPPPELRVALSEPGEAAYDKRLVGIWYWVGKNKREGHYLHIAPGKGTAYLVVVGVAAYVSAQSGDSVIWFRATAHASEVDGQTYYNVQRVAGAGIDYTTPGESPGFIIMRADVTDEDRLILRFMDTSHQDKGVLDGLIKEGRVRGRKVEGKSMVGHFKYLMLDMSRPELVALIREVTPEKLFKEVHKTWSRFRRLRPEAEKAKP